MKIAFVSDAIYPYNKGGKEKRIYEISTRLAKRSHNVHVFCMKWWKEKETHRIVITGAASFICLEIKLSTQVI